MERKRAGEGYSHPEERKERDKSGQKESEEEILTNLRAQRGG
jgi:hypothetical protein